MDGFALLPLHDRLEKGVEIVERKGRGHPDSICDALSEEVSRALSRHYLEHFGCLLHHNTDKVFLRAGSSRPRFGGGKITEPIEIYLGGRATFEARGVAIPVPEIAVAAAEAWLKANAPRLRIGRDVRLIPLLRPGSGELIDLFSRHRRAGVPLANDTSVGAGFAPLSELERLVLETERVLNASETKRLFPETGSDVKVMGIGNEDRIELTIACAFIDSHLPSARHYFEVKDKVKEFLLGKFTGKIRGSLTLFLNHADDPSTENVFLTVSGTSAEAGDDGETGRGNRVNGLITPFRPMSIEAAAGKNPMTHTGKLYQLAAFRVAEAVAHEVEGVAYADCFLGSQIGAPVTQPRLATIRVYPAELTSDASVRNRVEKILRRELDALPDLWKAWIAGGITVF